MKRINGDLGVAFFESNFAASAPALGEFEFVVLEGAKEQVCEPGKDDDDEKEAQKSDGILKYEAAERCTLLGGERMGRFEHGYF